MDIRAWIEKTRAKPEAQRERIVLLGALVVTALLFLFWIFDFSMTAHQAADSTTEEAPSPISILKENVSAVFSTAADSIKGITAATTTESH